MKKILKLISFACALSAILMSCEGPEGPAGADGTAVCSTCHNDGTDFTAKVNQFDVSAHALGTYFSRTGSNCNGCHSTEGFLARINHTSVTEMVDNDIDDQSAISCRTCHKVHVANDATDWELTFADQVTETVLGSSSPLVASSSFEDIGDNNMCVQCHQSRDPGNLPDIASTADVGISHHWGPHHGPQGNILNSQGGVNVAGSVTYPTASAQHDCMKCHMSSDNHSLAVDESACTSCHTDIGDDLEAIQDEVEGKLVNLGRSLATLGVLTPDTESEWVWNDGLGVHEEKIDTVGYHAKGTGYGEYSPLNVSADLARAVFNYLIVAEDQSLGVHNPDYVNALLDNTIESLP